MKKRYLLLIIIPGIFFAACRTPVADVSDSAGPVSYNRESGILNKALRDISLSSPDSLTDVYYSLKDSEAGWTEYGRDLFYIAYKLLKILYPLAAGGMEEAVPPATSIYPPIFLEIESGRFPNVDQENISFLTLLLSPAALLFADDPEVIDICRDSLEQIQLLDPGSIIPFYLSGFLNEKEGDIEEALKNYRGAGNISDSCYPAEAGIARIEIDSNPENTLRIVNNLILKFPDNAEFLILGARAQFALGNYSAALDATIEVLRNNPEDVSLLFLRAKILEAQGNNDQAERLLTIIGEEMETDVEFLLMKARILFRKSLVEESVAVLRTGMALYPDKSEFNELYGRILMESGSVEEGRSFLTENLEINPDSLSSLRLLREDAVTAGDWKAAGEYTARILELDTDSSDLLKAVEVYAELGENPLAETYAEELYKRNSGKAEYILPYIGMLITNEKNTRALDIINRSLKAVSDSTGRSDLYYAQSLLQRDNALKLDSLRSALLENLLNIDALTAISRLHLAMGDIRKAYRYMKQAVSHFPDDEDLQKELSALEQRM